MAYWDVVTHAVIVDGKLILEKLVRMDDVKEWLEQKRITAHGDPARIHEIGLLDELLGELKQ